MRDDTAYESAREAWSLLADLLEEMLVYVRRPAAPDDAGRRWPRLEERIEAALQRLRANEDLLSGHRSTPPPTALVALLGDAEAVATQVQLQTFIKHALDSESALLRIRRLIRQAEGGD
jgi:hypothetical protein